MTADLKNTFTAEAALIKSELFQFNNAAALKAAVVSYYGRVKRLLRKAHGDLAVDMTQLHSNSTTKLSLNMTQLDMRGEALILNQVWSRDNL